MKKIIFLVIAICFITSNIMALDIESLKKWFLKFDIEAELNYYIDEKLLVVVDKGIFNTGDIRFEISYLFTSFDFYLKYKKIDPTELKDELSGIMYVAKDFIVRFNINWIISFLQTKKSDKQKVISDFLINEFKEQRNQFKY